MSILDFGFSSPRELKRQLRAAAPRIEQFLRDSGLVENDWFKLLQAGYSPKDVLGLTDGEMEALFQSGYQALESGDAKSAELMFSKLCQLDSLDARYPFALGAALQVQRRFDVAARVYLIALALKATWVDVYVQLGECLLAAGEHEEARDVLGVAKALVLKGYGEEDVKARAEAVLARLPSEAVGLV